MVLFTSRSFGFIADVAHRVGARLGIPATGYQSDSMKDGKQEELIEEEESRWVESQILALTILFLIYQHDYSTKTSQVGLKMDIKICGRTVAAESVPG